MKTPLKRPISSEHPLLILMVNHDSSYDVEGRELVRMWNDFDPIIREHATVQIEGTQASNWERCDTILRYAEPECIPITLQIQGDNGERHDSVPPARVRRFLDQYDCIVGLQIVEASQRTFVAHGAGPEYGMGRNARYARDMILLAAEYGLFLSWQLMRDNWAAIGCSVDNEALFATIRDHAEYVIPQHEMNCEFSKQIDHTAALGLWLSGAVGNWGVEAQSWYWSDSGYDRPGVCVPGTLDMPGGLYAIMFLLGAVGGATAYSIEPPKDVWKGPDAWRFTEYLAPIFRRLVVERLIPSRDDVFAATPVAYHLPRACRPDEYYRALEDLDFDHACGYLARAAYGVYERSRDAELIPNTPRYGWIPVLPTETSSGVLDRFERVIRPGEIESTKHASKLLDEYYPPIDRGEAWSAVVGCVTVAANTHEFWPIPESVKLSVPRVPTNVRFDGDVLKWDRAKGDREWFIWRLRDGEECRLTERPVGEPFYCVTDYEVGDRYAVSAITDERETLCGTLHLHDFLLFDSRESRRGVWVDCEGVYTESSRIGERFVGASEETMYAEQRAAACSPVEDLASPLIEDGENASVKRDVLGAMTQWKHAIESENVDQILHLYHPDYCEHDGRTVESVRVAFRCLLWSQLRDRFDGMRKEIGRVFAWRHPVVRLLVREWVSVSSDEVWVRVVHQMWAGTGSEMEPSDMLKLPHGRSHDMQMVWRRDGERWLLASTDPPFLQAEDLYPFRYTYQGW